MQTELQNPTEDIARLKRQLEQEAKRRAWLENLVAEAIHHEYLDRVTCPPTWIAEAQLATQK
jgi:dephospho-CoA kinase